MNIYFGDLHNHCGITYGYGGLENALKAAKEQLDFCAIIGHASWHDIPKKTPELEFLVNFHEVGFEKLNKNWEEVREVVKNANHPHEFVTFQGYEAHSSEYGDHHFLSPNDDLPLVYGNSPEEIIRKINMKNVIAVPHHVGYTPGYRGGNWGSFNEEISPIIEVYSKHGCGMSDESMYPYYHDMGPRDSRSTIYAALKKGHRFGFAGSTDHHAGYPGSYGDGRVAVLAQEKTREAIWEAILARRTYAITGDKIGCDFKINGSPMGSEITNKGTKNIELSVKASDAIDKIIIFKDLKPWKIINGETMPLKNESALYKVRIEMGWGTSETGFSWDGNIDIDKGTLESVETCFRGRSVLAPSPNIVDDDTLNELNNKLIKQTETNAKWSCVTFKNPTTLHSHTAAVILEIEGDESSTIHLQLNGMEKSVTIEELLEGSQSKHIESYNSEAVLIHKAIKEEDYTFEGKWEDPEQASDCDIYHVEVKQVNNQFAWISPIFVKA